MAIPLDGMKPVVLTREQAERLAREPGLVFNAYDRTFIDPKLVDCFCFRCSRYVSREHECDGARQSP